VNVNEVSGERDSSRVLHGWFRQILGNNSCRRAIVSLFDCALAVQGSKVEAAYSTLEPTRGASLDPLRRCALLRWRGGSARPQLRTNSNSREWRWRHYVALPAAAHDIRRVKCGPFTSPPKTSIEGARDAVDLHVLVQYLGKTSDQSRKTGAKSHDSTRNDPARGSHPDGAQGVERVFTIRLAGAERSKEGPQAPSTNVYRLGSMAPGGLQTTFRSTSASGTTVATAANSANTTSSPVFRAQALRPTCPTLERLRPCETSSLPCSLSLLPSLRQGHGPLAGVSEPNSRPRRCMRVGYKYSYSADPVMQTTLGGAVSSGTLISARYSARRRPRTESHRTV
jgi:hypothetical protein